MRQVHEIRRSILDIDELNNAQLPINALPEEILLEVFSLVEVAPPLSGGENCSRVSTRMAIQAVCRHWRRVLCSNPGSWRTIEVRSRSEWLRICLERCADAPADITLHPRSHTVDTWLILAQHASAIRSMTIRGLDESGRTSVVGLLVDHQWPILQRLKISPVVYSSRAPPPAIRHWVHDREYPLSALSASPKRRINPPTYRPLTIP
ncbi:hypothetical protein L227DRAFT_573813 [Lentinus tigrinus ALCF2SS1-6]|uniref:Uncharacterized protein n=1 Tax=Lentinus tigrinus ALCF2SS1-6 TaxID=1328759 RepID=A0A5C2SE02_9APHY|nr:hypothetical protein L227DRAFT_573813 [Lentinus tigrinus ALCF2SS1-6]